MSKTQAKNLIAEGKVTEFADAVALAQDVGINNCLQCRKCSAGCPMVEKMDMHPVQLLHAVRLGLKDEVLASNAYWLCVGCGACVTRCPFKIDTPAIMDKLSQVARAEGRKPAEKDISIFWDLAGNNIINHGEMYELGIMIPLKLRTLNLFADIPMGLKLITQGKMEILPPSQNKKDIKEIAKRVKDKEGKK